MDVPTRTNTAILFLDLQEDIIPFNRTLAPERLERVCGALADLTALHKLPSFLSAASHRGAFMRSVLAALNYPEPRMRVQTSAFADAGLASELNASGRKVLVLAGIASEVVVQRTALDALAAGYTVYVAVDACGGIDARTEDAAWRRISAAGGAMTSVVTLAAELTGDFTTELGEKTLGIVHQAIGA